jgi:hypothetical protein
LQGFYGANNQGKYVMIQNTQNNPAEIDPKISTKRPNETGSISVEGFVKIFDPTTKEIFVEKRA